MNKKVLCLIIALLLLSSCTINHENDNDYNTDEVQNKIQNKNTDVIKISSHGTKRNVSSFEDSIKNCYLIIEANLTAVEPNIVDFPNGQKAQTGYLYTYDDLSIIKGQYPEEEITVTYSNEVFDNFISINKGIHRTGEKHYLLLCRKYSVYWDEDIYIPYNYIAINGEEGTSMFSVDGNNIQNNLSHASLNNMVKNIIQKGDSNEENIANWGVEFIKSNSISDIFEFSDIVVEVETKEIEVDGGNTIFANCEVIECYKGQFDNSKTIIFLAKDFEFNKKYLLLLSDEPGSYFLSSKNSCIPIEDTEKYEEYMKYIKN